MEELEELYAYGVEVDPLVGVPFDNKFVISSDERAVLLVDGRHRTFAAVAAGIETLPVYVLIT